MAIRSLPVARRDDHVPLPPAMSAPEQRTPSLGDIVRRLASTPETWIDRVRLTVDRRWYECLYSGPDHDVWAIAWMPGQSTGFHDHGGSSGAYCVVHGVLEDHRPDQPRRTVGAGDVQSFGPNLVHDVRNTSSAPAISLHAYSPALTGMRHYEVDSGGVRPLEHFQTPTRANANHFIATVDSPVARDEGQADEDLNLARVDRLLSASRRGLQRLTPEESHRAVDASAAILIDIRPVQQRGVEGAIPGALIVERNVLEWRLDPTSPDRLDLPIDRDTLVILVCSEGYASSLAAESLQKLGLWRATDMIGGFKAWEAAGLPTIGSDRWQEPYTAQVIHDHVDAQLDLVSTAWLESRLGDPSIRIVESSADGMRYAGGHIPGAIHVGWGIDRTGRNQDAHIPSSVFDGLMSSLGATVDTTVVLYADDDRSASFAFAVFQLFGHLNVKLLQGGLGAWVREKRPLTTSVPKFVRTQYRVAEQDGPSRVFVSDASIASEGRIAHRLDSR